MSFMLSLARPKLKIKQIETQSEDAGGLMNMKIPFGIMKNMIRLKDCMHEKPIEIDTPTSSHFEFELIKPAMMIQSIEFKDLKNVDILMNRSSIFMIFDWCGKRTHS